MNSITEVGYTSKGYSGAPPVPARPQARTVGWPLLVFYMLHIPLALLIYRSPAIATAHALATFLVGLWWALRGGGHLAPVAYVGAYIVGAEVLWRMAGAQVFWEFGKYACAAIFIAAMLRRNLFRGSWLPLLYFALLLPSAMLTVAAAGSSKAQEDISSNLSGPFALWICGWFFSHLRLSRQQLQRLLLALIGPVASVAVVTIYALRSSSDLTFSNNSNFVTSGGFGPNQVSNILGLGALMSFLLVMERSAELKLRALMFGVTFLCAIQCALTFSRGGLYSATGAAMAALLYLMKDRRSRVKVILISAILIGVANYIVLPRLDNLTGGALSTRLRTTDPTGRDRIAFEELEIWKENPVLGVGPGQARALTRAAAHTEFTRLVAEHGSLGFIALLLVITMGLRNLKGARTAKNKALVVAMMGWSFLFMVNAGMRLAAPSFAFGLGFATLLPELRRIPISFFRNYLDRIVRERPGDQGAPLKA